MRNITTCEERLKSMMVMDRSENPQKINKVLKAEILYLLNNYFDINSENLELDLGLDNNGEYILSITAKSRFLKIAHVIGS